MHMSGPKLDAKFYGQVRKVKDDTLVDESGWMVFLAQDNAFAETLPIYRNICKIIGADQEHLDSVDRTIERMKRWRQEHPDKCKVPDAKGERLLG